MILYSLKVKDQAHLKVKCCFFKRKLLRLRSELERKHFTSRLILDLRNQGQGRLEVKQCRLYF